jgi:hypothetical protein
LNIGAIDISNAGIPQIANQTVQELDGECMVVVGYERELMVFRSDNALFDYEHHDCKQDGWFALVA